MLTNFTKSGAFGLGGAALGLVLHFFGEMHELPHIFFQMEIGQGIGELVLLILRIAALKTLGLGVTIHERWHILKLLLLGFAGRSKHRRVHLNLTILSSITNKLNNSQKCTIAIDWMGANLLIFTFNF